MGKHKILHIIVSLALAVLLVIQAVPMAWAASGKADTADAPETVSGAENTPQPEPTPEGEDLPTPEPAGDLTPAPSTDEPEPTAGPEDGEPDEPTPEPDEPTPEPDEPTPEPDPEDDGEEGRGEKETPPKAYAAEAIGTLKVGAHDAYLTGFTGKRFCPYNKMTRGEVSVMLYALLKEKPTDLEYNFSDVKSTDWYGPAIAAMSKLGAVTGYSDGTFRPKNPITRAEFVVILANFFEMPEEKLTADFADVTENHWAYRAIAFSQSKGWTAGFEDGTFRPTAKISRAEVVTIVNVALERRGEGFAADRATQEFVDVPKDFWAFLDIAEAADPAPEPDPTPTPNPSAGGFTVGGTVKVNADTGLNIRTGPGTNYSKVTAVVNGTLLTVTDVSKYPWLGVKTSGGQSGYSLSDYLVVYSGGNNSQNGTLSASSVTVAQYQSYRLDAKAGSNISTMKWSSSNANVAKVAYTINYNTTEQSAIVYAGSPGTAVLSFADSNGNVKATCTVKVTEPEAVRFAYADGNTVPLGSSFDLVAVTDTNWDGMRFEIVDGPAGGAYITSSYTEETSTSDHGLPTNKVRVFRRTVEFGVAGLYTVRAYPSTSGFYSTDSYSFTVLVTQAASVTTATSDTRRASGKIIDILAVFEGYVPEIEDDKVVAGNPTVGYGYVVTKSEPAFYNNLTRTEAYAMLVDTVNNGTYSKAVENFRKEHNIKMSQAQYDALVSFVYNCGTGALSLTRYDTPNIILNMVAPPTDASASNPYTGTLNVVSAKMYAQADSGSATVLQVPKGAAVRVTGVQVNRSSAKQEVWYHVSYNGSTGWIPSGYVKLSGNFARDLNYADSTSLANEFLQWHRAGGRCVPGLLYRRLAECKVFFFGNYEEAVNGHANYRKNRYGFLYPSCCKNLDQR